MGTIATLDQSSLHVEPGGEATATLTVRNTGTVVDEFTFDALGPLADWVAVDPTVLRLLPGMEEQVQVSLRPPRSPEVPTGGVPLGLRVNSKEDPEGSATEEWVVTVSPFVAVTAELLPRTSRGRRVGVHEIAVDNRGNDLANIELLAYDDAEALEFEFDDPGLVAEANAATFTKLHARPRKRFWRGKDKTWPFKVELHPSEGPPVLLEGTMLQQPLVPRWLGRALLALLAAILLLTLLWFTLFKPAIESAAREGIAEELALQEAVLAAQQEQLDQQAAATSDTGQAVEALTGQVSEISEAAGGQPPVVVEGPTVVDVPRDFRLATSAGAGSSATDTMTFDDGETFALTDVVLQNPAGNIGELRVRRGTQTLLVVALENFRDLDYHFVAPIVFGPGDSLVLQVVCTEVVAPGSAQCGAAGFFSGSVQTIAEGGAGA
jgi:hypothetical protein